MKRTVCKWGEVNGKEVFECTLSHDSGSSISVLNYGGIITKLIVPDNNGNLSNVVLGYDSLEKYQKASPFFGALCGRVAGRIGKASFKIDKKSYDLVKNNGENHLHGGLEGFDKKVFDIEEIENGVSLAYVSPDGEEGYPGNLSLVVNYTFTEDNLLTIEYHAHTDKETPINLTNHTYFNLSGDFNKSATEQVLMIDSDKIIELDEELIPTGQLIDITDTAFDFRVEKTIVNDIEDNHDQLRIGGGYDHPYVLNKNVQDEILLKDPSSGRKLTIETNQKCVVFYSGNFIPEGEILTEGIKTFKRQGICLETHGYSNAVNEPLFPDGTLKPGENYYNVTKYKFDTK